MASADGLHWIPMAKRMFLFSFNSLLPPALCQDPIGCVLNWVKNGLEMKNNIFSQVPWFTVAVAQTCAKGRQMKGMCLWQWQQQHPVSPNPAKSTGCWLYTLVLQTLHLTPGFAYRTRNSTFFSLPQWTQGFLREAQCWGSIRDKGDTQRIEGLRRSPEHV